MCIRDSISTLSPMDTARYTSPNTRISRNQFIPFFASLAFRTAVGVSSFTFIPLFLRHPESLSVYLYFCISIFLCFIVAQTSFFHTKDFLKNRRRGGQTKSPRFSPELLAQYKTSAGVPGAVRPSDTPAFSF